MFECKVTQNADRLFTPFVLNMRITTRQSARNLYQLLKPTVYGCPVNPLGLLKEQRQMTEDICNMLSETVNNIEGGD